MNFLIVLHLEIISVISSQDPSSLFDSAIEKYEKRDFDGAIDNFNRALAVDSKYAAAYNGRGAAKQAKGDLEGALADFARALELDPKLADAYYNRGLLKKTKGDLEGALADYNRSIEINPNTAKGHFDYKGGHYYFCSEDCLNKFKAAPEKYVK